MHYKVRVFIGTEAEKEGWLEKEESATVTLNNNLEKIQVKITDERILTQINGKGSVIIVRENKLAKLANKVHGRVQIGDVVWLLNTGAENEYKNGEREIFLGAAVKIEIGNEILETKKEKQNIIVKERFYFQEKNNKKINLILGLVVFVLLAVGTILGYQKRTEGEQKSKYEIIKRGETKITEIESVRTVNIETALELAKNAESMINNAGIAEKKYSKELADLKEKIVEIQKGLGGENVNLEVAYDTTLILEGNDQFKGIAVKDNQALLWSNSTGVINIVDFALKSTEKIVSDERIKNWLGIFYNGDRWYGYAQDKIYEIKRNSLVETEIRGMNTVGEMTGWNGLIYALDKGSQNIVKLSEGNGKNWLKEGVVLAEEAGGISIDSNIWVLGKSGKIYEYTRGAEEKFNMSFLPAITSARNLKTSDKVDFLAYVADDNMVVIYGKDGKILGKYNFSEIKINDIGIENQNRAELVLAKNGKIYRIKIK